MLKFVLLLLGIWLYLHLLDVVDARFGMFGVFLYFAGVMLGVSLWAALAHAGKRMR